MDDIRTQVTDAVSEVMARLFRMDKAEVAAHPELRLKEDLQASSKHYFPILATISSRFGLDIDYHVFQYSATTVGEIVDFVCEEHAKQNG